jgi:hypothetical protein
MSHYKVSKTETGEYLVQQKPGFVASYINKEWVPRLMFNAYEQNELVPVKDKQEAERIFNEAHKVLDKKLQTV